MEDVTSLVLKVESSQVGKASKEVDKLSKSSVKAEKTTNKVAGAFTKLLGPLLAVVSATAALNKLVSITREFDILNAQLITATGSAEGAAVAFEAIQKFGVETPFQLGEVTEAFVQLVNRGLDPSIESLTNIGNFASAFGRNILDATRAIAQATTGEFESLKQFGIVSKKVGDEVNFTFRGITKTVGFNAKEIQGYMNDLAANNFAGAMEERMNSLDGAISNLEDSWDKFWLTTSQEGTGQIAQEVVLTLIAAVEKLEEVVTGNKAGALFEAFALSLKLLREQAGTVEFEELATKITTIGVAIDRFGAAEWRTEQLDSYLGTYQKVVSEFDKKGLETAIRDIESAITNQEGSVESLLNKLAEDPGSNVVGLQAEEATQKLAVLREMLKGVVGELTNFQSVEDSDATVGFGVGADPTDTVSAAEQSRIEKSFERLQDSLLSEEEAIEASFQKRMETAQEYAKLTGESVADVEDRIRKSHAEEVRQLEMKRWDTALSSFDDFQNNMLTLAKVGNDDLAAVFKAAAIANTTIKTYESATSAYAAMAGIPLVGPALGAAAAAAAVAAGLANVSAIANQQVGGYADGGIIPGGNFNGDNLNANVNSGEMILNFSQQKQLLNMANGSGGGGAKPTIVNVQNFGPGEVEVEETETDREKIINIAVNRAVKEVNNNIRTGSGDTERALQTRDKRTG
tara:strand:- start:26148 stop:28211 length:2064 start_codon:yes stop_codon:yes gene_type:complete